MSPTAILFVSALTLGAGPDAAPAKVPLSLTVANTSGLTVREIYVSPVKSPKWGTSLIKKPLARGQAAALSLPGGCGRYDIRMVIDERTEMFEDDVELCADGYQLRVMDTALETKKVQ